MVIPIIASIVFGGLIVKGVEYLLKSECPDCNGKLEHLHQTSYFCPNCKIIVHIFPKKQT